MEQTKKYIDEHAASWPENYAIGRAAYDAMLRDEELLPFNSDDIERMARDELAHGWAVQSWMEELAAERGTPIGPESGGGLAPGGAALIDYYRARIAQLREFVAQHHVVDVPEWLGEIAIIETPKFLQPVSPGASMYPPLLFSKGTTGFYFITPPTSLAEAAKNLDANQDFDRDRILSTAAHEAMPGHFLQLSIARRHPDFVRKIQGSGEFSDYGVLVTPPDFKSGQAYPTIGLRRRPRVGVVDRLVGVRDVAADHSPRTATSFYFPIHAVNRARVEVCRRIATTLAVGTSVTSWTEWIIWSARRLPTPNALASAGGATVGS